MYQPWDHDIFRILFFNYDDGQSSVDKTQSEINHKFSTMEQHHEAMWFCN